MPNGANGGLKKMVIEAYTNPGCSGEPADKYEVMFNPTTVSRKYGVEYHDRQGPGDSGSPQIPNKIRPSQFSFEFVIDGTGAVADGSSTKKVGDPSHKKDVEKEVKDFLTVTGKYQSELHRPYYLKISWGSFIWLCVLSFAEVTYTLFKPDGDPLRARIKATFEEQKEDPLRVAEEGKKSPDLTHVHTVQAGDSLSLLCQRYYGDPGRYLQIAQYNGLKNYRRLEPGLRLQFPPIKNA